jgi:hypothetical protein
MKASQCAVRSIDTETISVNPCAWCRHFEFLHANPGLCLFSECTCPFYDPGPIHTVEVSGDVQ